MYDVVVVGAGPAGSIAALNAAKEGADVLVIEERENIGNSIPCCGEGIVYRVLEDHAIPVSSRYIATEIDKIKLVLPSGKEGFLKMKYVRAYVLYREKLEEFLIQRASDEGAEIKLGCKAKKFLPPDEILLSNGEVVKGKAIIGCDGYPSLIARDAGFNSMLPKNDIAVCKQYTLEGIDLDDNTIEIFWGHKYSPRGYVWVFPKGKGCANVGLGIISDQRCNINDLLDSYVKERFPEGNILREIRGVIPLARPVEEPVKGKVLIAGDAAHHVLAHTGSGMGTSMLAGKFAGQVAGEYATGAMNSLQEYANLLKPLNKKLNYCYNIKKKLWLDENYLNGMYYKLKLVQILHKIFPKTIETEAFLKMRY